MRLKRAVKRHPIPEGGAKHLETADILPNCMQGGIKRKSPVANWLFDRHKIWAEMKKIA